MKPLIIVCGLGRTGYKIYNLLQQQGAEVVGISDRPMTLRDREKLIIGDARSPAILVKAGIRKAHTLVLGSNDDALNLAILFYGERESLKSSFFFHTLTIVVKMINIPIT